MIFVFGSNLAGRHGKGAALAATKTYGAVYGIGEGRTGNSYALPTKDANIKTRSLVAINNPDLDFQVTKIGCGLAGFKESDIAPLFKNAPVNCYLPENWR